MDKGRYADTVMGTTYSRRSTQKRKRDGRKRKMNLILLVGVMLVIGIALSGGSFTQFFAVLSIEVVCVAILLLSLILYKSKSKSKPKSSYKAASRQPSAPAKEPRVTRNSAYRHTEKTETPIKKKYDWVVEQDVKKEVATTAESVINPENDIKTQVANWSKLVDYSGTVFNRIKEQSAPKVQVPETVEIEEKNEVNHLAYFAEEEDTEDGNGSNRYVEQETEYTMDWTLEEPEEDVLRNENINEIRINMAFDDEEELSENEEGNEDEIIPGYTEVAADETEFEEFEEIDEPAVINHEVLEIEEDEEEQEPEAQEERKKVLVKGLYNAKNKIHIKPRIPDSSTQIQRQEPQNTENRIKQSRPDVKPPIGLLKASEAPVKVGSFEYSAENNAKKLIDTLSSFGVGAKIINISKGPSVTRYELQPDYGVKVSKIVNLTDDIALNLAATGVRIEAPIPGKAAIGIEIPNKEVTPVFLRDVIESQEFQSHPSKVAFAVGKDIAGNVVIADIAKMPHLLIAGATGSGKSVCINTLITSILYKASPEEVKLLMVDPKVVELSIYNGIPHLLIPVVTDPKKAAGALNWAVQEMTIRYKLFADNNVRDLRGYNHLMRERGESILPQVVIIIDELADLMMVAPNEVEDCICRLAQMARAAGMHLVIATQRPSVDVITGVIKANVPSRISFAVSSQIDSRTILDMAGAEKLLGRGDMLFNPLGISKPVRVQGGLITDKEVESIVSFIKANCECQYDDDVLEKIDRSSEAAQADPENDDELLPQVVNMVIEQGQASTSLIQRKFKLGYSRAARIVDQLEANGIVGPFEGSKPRKVLITKQQWLEMNG
ncbi:MAG: DNA translocase FtsK [Clostridia bacterium]|nr:DNA translocase FtsK [Clostridia bacterium]